ncbi:uncharacterized protein CPUR_07199 [Claviceps purpurea 20.1]|uniref:RNAse P Rpr2/Rpp21 subunit domain protein n=1 Tax=Claviceps purpurea (strain 20.1) TaxID=1111077 RepID=M1WAW5_CLAP2|nr:hypothetical protein E4U28_000681 [Claviceps purpurea]CCE33275.1 uncharacterized protein CPUR_07199 [Claviceps purpurea 20.1]KAG6133388.1 hypothetical protein E4U12_002778 [Claviceps purpurea]KAG6240098.1 hypothetical protein E4U25_008445 [Claviceps purpurea]KAG6265462.1 hypothetical protein E4U49_001004 [Claviceps purpurea]
MAKPKGQPGVQNRVIYSRASYLYQAATYLSNCADSLENAASSTPSKSSKPELGGVEQQQKQQQQQQQYSKQKKAVERMSRLAISEMKAVSLKAQIRQSPALKRTVCKFCDTLLVEGRSCSSTIENLSKQGRKPWADVLVITCKTCGNVKRFPVDAPRQKRKSLRLAEANISG